MTDQHAGGAGARAHQMFPVLTAKQVETACRFASDLERKFAPGDVVYATGDRNVPVWLVLDGSIDVQRRDGLDDEAPITTHVAGQFTGEVSQIDGRASIASARAGPQGATLIPFDPPHLRALMIGSAEIGEIVMRALILRRVGLIEQGGSGTILIGAPDDAHLLRLQGFLTRSGYPNLVVDPKVDDDSRSFVERMALLPTDLPLVVCPNGKLLKRPNERELATCLGIIPKIDVNKTYDIVVVGAGPAGLAAAVYGASEGLSVIVLDERAMGGQAGASARIENYLGFPTGISGQALAGRAFNQALKFGAEVAIPVAVERFERTNSRFNLHLSGDWTIGARAIVIASGATYQRPDIPGLARFEGSGISYWASPVEARLCMGKDVALVGGGNSAGQAIVFLAPRVKRLHVFVRRDLSETMSRYLIDRISVLPNVEIHVGTDLVELGCDGDVLSSAIVRDRVSGAATRYDISHLFLFIGARPHTRWLAGWFGCGGRQGLHPDWRRELRARDQHAGSVRYRRRPGRLDQARRSRSRRRCRGNRSDPRLPQQAGKGSGMNACGHMDAIRDVAPSARGCEECLKVGSPWVHLRLCRTCGHVGCCDDSPLRHARAHFGQSGHPIIEGYDPPEGWGWCYIDQVAVALPDQTPQGGPIPRFI